MATTVIKLEHEITQMKKSEDKFFTICNYNQLNIIDLTSKNIERTVLFQDQNITTIHVTDKFFLYADNFNYIYAVKLTDLDVRFKFNFVYLFVVKNLSFLRMQIWRRKK